MIMVTLVLTAKQGGLDDTTLNKTIDALNWSDYQKDISMSLQSAAIGKPQYIVYIVTASDKLIDFVGYTTMSVAKLAMEVARDNPDIINFRVLLILLLLFMIAPLIYPMFVLVVSIILLTKEFIEIRKEKKEMRRLKQDG